MKRLLLLTGFVFGLMAFSYQASDITGVVNAFKSADASQIGSFFDEYVDIKLLDKSEVKNMGRNQATITLKTFFAENNIKGFEKLSEREMGGTMYLAGKLLDGGKGLNVTVLMKVKDGKPQIITLRIN